LTASPSPAETGPRTAPAAREGDRVFVPTPLAAIGRLENACRYGGLASGRLYGQSDPIGLQAGSWSTYGYAFSNPLSNIDPTGEAPPGRAVPPGISIPVPLPPIVIPGTPENDAWVQSAYQQISDAINAVVSMCKDNDREKRCDHQYYKVDIPTCRGVARNRGQAAGERCYASAAQRYAACLRGQPLPPLDTYNN